MVSRLRRNRQVASFAVLYVVGKTTKQSLRRCGRRNGCGDSGPHRVGADAHLFINHSRTTSGICVSLVGTGFLVGFANQAKKVCVSHSTAHAHAQGSTNGVHSCSDCPAIRSFCLVPQMMDPVRLSATLLLLGSIALTFVSAFVWGIDALVIIFAVSSYVFLLWYSLSYIVRACLEFSSDEDPRCRAPSSHPSTVSLTPELLRRNDPPASYSVISHCESHTPLESHSRSACFHAPCFRRDTDVCLTLSPGHPPAFSARDFVKGIFSKVTG